MSSDKSTTIRNEAKFTKNMDSSAAISEPRWVRESTIGRHFLASGIWLNWVLIKSFEDFGELLTDIDFSSDRVLDAGCGHGLAFPLLEKYFSAKHIIGVDIDPELINQAKSNPLAIDAQVNLLTTPIEEADIPEDSLDLIYSHQLLHHTAQQKQALEKFRNSLKPGATLLVAESCKNFINLWWVKLFFRHPSSGPKTADQYIEMLIEANFEILKVRTSTPWWSRLDLGLLEKLRLVNAGKLAPTEILIVARKPR